MKNRILEIDKSEVVLHHIRRHPLGLVGIILTVGTIFIAYLAGLFFFIKNLSEENGEITLTIGAILLGLLIILIGYIATYVYRQNELIVTNENIILINQLSLFSRKISQLNLAKIQDVSGDQDNFIENMLGFGTLTIETAGETKNFIFHFCPDPAISAKHIIEAHEQFIQAANSPAHRAPQNAL